MSVKIIMTDQEYKKSYQEAFGFADELAASYKYKSEKRDLELNQMELLFEEKESGGDHVRRFNNT